MSADADFKQKVPKLGEMKPVDPNVCHHVLHLTPLVGEYQKNVFLFIYWASSLSIQAKDVRKISSKNPSCGYVHTREEIVLSCLINLYPNNPFQSRPCLIIQGNDGYNS